MQRIDCTHQKLTIMSTINHEISLEQAIDMTARYRANRPSDFPLSETFDIEAISQLVSATGCAYLRIYYGMQEDLSAHAILVAANENNEDILPEAFNAGDIVILEDGTRCPPDCPPASPLNSN